MVFYTEYSSPIGKLLPTSEEDALTGLWMDTQVPPAADMIRADGLPLFTAVRQWLDAYFRGEPVPAPFPLSPSGTEFQHKIWEILLTIPYGETITYGTIAKEMAARIGKKSMSAQAVGGAVGRNPISIIISLSPGRGRRG